MADSITGGGFIFPPLLDNAPKSLPVSFTSYALGVTAGTLAFIGRVFIADRSPSKILSSAGGTISFLTGVSSITATAAIHVIGIQDVDATNGPPARPDNTFDVSATLTGSAGSQFTDNSWVTKAMTSGSKTLSHGELYAFVARAASSASVGGLRIRAPVNTTGGGASAFTVTMSATTNISVATLAPAGTPNVLFQCDDGTLAWLAGSTAISSVSAVSISSGGTNDEYGMRFTLPWTSQVDGLGVRVGGISTANYNIILYSDPKGTPVTLTSIAILGAQQPTSVTAVSHLIPITPITLTASTTYLLAVRAGAAAAITFQHLRFAAAANKISFPGGGSLARGARANDTGAFSMDETAIPAGFQVRINQIVSTASTVTATTTTTITTTITTTVNTGGMLVHPGMGGGLRG